MNPSIAIGGTRNRMKIGTEIGQLRSGHAEMPRRLP
jgi:hypothetical protein